jgi:hypothetical protein
MNSPKHQEPAAHARIACRPSQVAAPSTPARPRASIGAPECRRSAAWVRRPVQPDAWRDRRPPEQSLDYRQCYSLRTPADLFSHGRTARAGPRISKRSRAEESGDD